MALESVVFELFRLRLHETLFSSLATRKSAILSAVDSSFILNFRDHEWRIGNITLLDENGVYFTFGRKSDLGVIQYDSNARGFADARVPNWPFSHVFLDANLGVIAISRNSRLSREADSIANRLRDLFANYPPIADFWTVELKPIDDPDRFIEKLESAFSIKKFGFEFLRPNPFDIDEDLQKPLEEYLVESGAVRGEVEIEGANLNPTIIEQQARSAIVSSTNAWAVVKESKESPPIKISSQDNAFETKEIGIDPEDVDELRRGIEIIREIYRSLRLG